MRGDVTQPKFRATPSTRRGYQDTVGTLVLVFRVALGGLLSASRL